MVRPTAPLNMAYVNAKGHFQQAFSWTTVYGGIGVCSAIGLSLCYMRMSAHAIVSYD
jgi:hypothetical protein